jgi:hypothetical protein
MLINHLYHTWYKRIEQLRPGERVTRQRNLAWLLRAQKITTHLLSLSRIF